MDGTGKTTLTTKLVKTMNEHGIRTRYVWGQLHPGLLKPFLWLGKALFISHKGGSSEGTYIRYSKAIREVTHNPLVRSIYEFMLSMDYARQLLWTIRVPMLRGENIVSDRYGYDIVIDLYINLRYSAKKMARMLKIFYFLLPKPNLIFVIDAPEEIAFKRKNDISSIDHLNELRQVYLDIAAQCGLIVLDGSAELPTLQDEIWAKVQEVI